MLKKEHQGAGCESESVPWWQKPKIPFQLPPSGHACHSSRATCCWGINCCCWSMVKWRERLAHFGSLASTSSHVRKEEANRSPHRPARRKEQVVRIRPQIAHAHSFPAVSAVIRCVQQQQQKRILLPICESNTNLRSLLLRRVQAAHEHLLNRVTPDPPSSSHACLPTDTPTKHQRETFEFSFRTQHLYLNSYNNLLGLSGKCLDSSISRREHLQETDKS